MRTEEGYGGGTSNSAPTPDPQTSAAFASFAMGVRRRDASALRRRRRRRIVAHQLNSLTHPLYLVRYKTATFHTDATF